MRHLSIDIETFSSVGIQKCGLYRYVQSADFKILLFAYSVDFGSVEIIDLARGQEIPFPIHRALLTPEYIKHAYNAAFEWYCLSKHLQVPEPTAWLPQWQCTMLHGLYCGYTAGLAATAKALGLPEEKQKMAAGRALIKTFCVPCPPTVRNGNRTRTLPHHEPERWETFKEYCRQDVVTEMEIERRLSAFPVPDGEQSLWQLDQRINAGGIRVDRKLIAGALDIEARSTEMLTQEATTLSGLDNPKSVAQLKDWLQKETEEEIPDLQKVTVSQMIQTTGNDKVKRMLQVRQELSKTSVKKYQTMENALGEDSRIRGVLQFYGANRTGRWAGRLVQVHNLPRNYIPMLGYARELVKARNLDALKLTFGNVPDTLSQLIRTTFIPSPGNVLVVADFSAIEARVIAWLAGEQWRQEVFATHGKIYEASASAMFGVPIERIVKGNPEYELRQKGKVAELALGYQGGPGALITMGALRNGLTEEELPEIVQKWRAANKRIVDLWYAVENAALQTVRTGQPTGIRGLLFAREASGDLDFLTLTLPSGRKLFYAKPILVPNQWGKESISYMGMNQTTRKWELTPTYGGKLVENCVQAIARDCLAESMVRLHNDGYHIVMHIHDEVVLDEPRAVADPDRVCDLMGQPVSWAPGLLLKAEGFVSEFYKKE